jgi:hypothetical protein
VDDIVVKSTSTTIHIQDLEEMFKVMKEVGMHLNPAKSFFGLSGRKFLSFIVSERGIEIHPSKCCSILEMPLPKIVKEVQTLTGRITALNRFISRSGEVCSPFFQTLKKARKFTWDDECEKAFLKLKMYLTQPSIISRPV